MINTSYRYIIKAIYSTEDNRYIEIPQENITYLSSNYDYLQNHMPTLYLGFKVNSELYDEMVINVRTSKIILTVYKYDNSSVNSLRHIYIQKKLDYAIRTDPDYHQSLNNMNEDADVNESYKSGTLGLFDSSLLDDNDIFVNGIIKDSNMISIVHKYTKHMNMVIEPFINNNKIDTLIIPPITSITRLLNFLNNYSCFYSKGYRYFRDFDKTYVLSNTGKAVSDGEDVYHTMIINILDTTDPLTKSVGIDIDKSKKTYVMNIDALDTTININITRNKEYNSIVGVTSTGELDKVRLEDSLDEKERILLQRIPNDNLTYLQNIKHEIDSSSVVLQISRTEIDSSIITPNKEYIIRNFKEYSEYNGTFLLISKKEIFIQQDNEFISKTILAFKKVMD